jgi:Rap1a immunity proteins
MLILLSLFAFSLPTNTGPQPAALIAACKEVRFVDGQTQNAQMCMMFIEGVVDGGTFVTRENPFACVAVGVTVGQLVDAVLKYAEAHPNALHQSSAALVANAIQVAFPCAKT